jgi:hypothetical protein
MCDEQEGATKERDEARALVLKIGLALRAFYRSHSQGWTPSEVLDIYALIDAQEWVKNSSSDG